MTFLKWYDGQVDAISEKKWRSYLLIKPPPSVEIIYRIWRNRKSWQMKWKIFGYFLIICITILQDIDIRFKGIVVKTFILVMISILLGLYSWRLCRKDHFGPTRDQSFWFLSGNWLEDRKAEMNFFALSFDCFSFKNDFF